jgi:hypothetical protein
MRSPVHQSKPANKIPSAVDAFAMKAMSSAFAWISRAAFWRTRSMSSYQLRKSQQAISSRRAKCLATASVARRGNWPNVAVFR